MSARGATRTLVTGAGGMLAQAAIPALAAAGHVVLALRRDEADVTDAAALARAAGGFRPDWILHLAAFTRVDDCETEVERAFLVNGLGARNAALAAAACGAAVLVVSSDYVFDGTAGRPYREHDAAAPLSVYGASKWAGEQAVREVHPRHVVVRTSWLFGRGGPNFLATSLQRARAGEALRVVDDQRGSPTATDDLAAGLVRLMARGEFGTYHCTNAGDCTWYELAEYALGRAGLRARLERTSSAALARPARRPAYSVLSNTWFDHVTGQPLPPWREAVDCHLRQAASAPGAVAR